MANVTLTDARVKALQPRKTVRDVRDGKLRDFGVRVLPSGRKRFFIHCQFRGERVWKIVGDAGSISVAEARSMAAEMLVAVRRGEEAPRKSGESLFEAVAEAVFQSYERVWKPGTLYANQHYLKNQIMPYFATCEIGDIARQDVRNWFASLRAKPAAADRSMPILSVIMREAEKMGLRPEGSNPCRGIRRYRRKGRERFLSEDEIRRLSARLSARAKRYPLQVSDLVRHSRHPSPPWCPGCPGCSGTVRSSICRSAQPLPGHARGRRFSIQQSEARIPRVLNDPYPSAASHGR